MTFLARLLGGSSGDDGSDAAAAALQAAQVQTGAVGRAIDTVSALPGDVRSEARRSERRVREDTREFSRLGGRGASSAQELLNPNKQFKFLQNNPVFKAAREDASRQIFSNAAARGKVGSGSTAEALQKSFLLLGDDFIGSEFNRRIQGAQTGLGGINTRSAATQNSGAQVNQALTQGATSVSDLITQGGNAEAAGIVGAANARTQAQQREQQAHQSGLGSLVSGIAGAAKGFAGVGGVSGIAKLFL